MSKRLKYDDDYFNEINNSFKAYWLGFIFADGCIDKYDRLHINLAKYDKSHLEKFLIQLNSNIEIRDRKNNIGEYVNLSIKNSNIVKSLYSLGVNYNKTYDSKMPKIEEKYISDWFRGYFDGDGSIGMYKDKTMKYGFIPKANIAVLSDDMTNFISSILKNKNIKHSINKDKKSNLNHINIRSINSVIKMFEFIYNNSNIDNRLERKYNKFYDVYNFFVDKGYGRGD